MKATGLFATTISSLLLPRKTMDLRRFAKEHKNVLCGVATTTAQEYATGQVARLVQVSSTHALI